MFLCTQIDEDDYRMTNYMEYSCYSFDHLKWAVFISAPILVIWVIGLPLVALLILLKNREHLDDWKIKKYFMILYQGFRKETFYWEFVSTFRKFSILAINAVLNNAPATYRIFLAITFLVVLYFLQKKIMPFSKQKHNNIDLLGVNVGILTFYCTILFSQEDLSQRGFYLLALFIVFISNTYFVLKWFYLVLCEMKWNNPYFIS